MIELFIAIITVFAFLGIDLRPLIDHLVSLGL